ncbi:hypothetical protein BGW36DRAFT_405426 [Talaromyces proteolyticus]|uniref:Uncharacterized protein n=1 Tax=Talaromyces proteolyticus TaxID=1131652 RepID=A0AAD4KY16_9EURO|nr:uncharacterized protein BGW36DRAFT_405426 [Talaromyces proteolyticus]KAH8700121.1 hypothetical protein BGW36DRAFT_405426 [Talaromyces proteolyticus]
MKDTSKLSQIARDVGVLESKRLRPLQPREPKPQWATAADVAAARGILVQQRTQCDSWKDPSKQKRRFLRSKEKNESLADPKKWKFSRVERSIALDRQIKDLGPVGVAQAILDFDIIDEPLDVNLMYSASLKEKNDFGEEKCHENDWLEYVTGKDLLDYVTFLVSYPTRQSAKDKALLIALNRRCMPVVRELLQYHSNPNGLQDSYFTSAVIEGDFELVGLFLSAPNPLEDTVINGGLVKSVEQRHSHLVSLLVAHGADAGYENGKAIEIAVRNRDLQDLSLMCLKSQKPLATTVFENAIVAACTIPDETLRNSIINILLCAGADPSHTALEDLLLNAVKVGSIPTVSLLIDHGTSPNRNEAECLQLAVQNLRLDLLEIILRNDVSANGTSKALERIPEEVPESQFRKLLAPLLNKGVTEEALGVCLARVVSKRFNCLADTLVKRGASLDYDDATCVRFALREHNLTLLETLLAAPCAAYNLAKAIPDAMAIGSNSVRRNAMHLLLRKGVSGRELHRALRTVIREEDHYRVDYELAELLIRHKASVDFIGSNGNCLQIATERIDLRAIKLLCRANPSPEVVSSALPFIFKSFNANDYSKMCDIVSVLLLHGARGTPLARALIDAVQQDEHGRIVTLLLENGADPNYKDGKAIEHALCATDTKILRLICENGRLVPSSLERLVPQVLETRCFSIDKAEPLIRCCAEYRSILDETLLLEVESKGCRRDLLDLLLELNVNVDYKDAAAVHCAVRKGDIGTTRMLLSKGPGRGHLSSLLKTASKIQGRKNEKLEMMRILLSHGGPGFGQDDILLQEIELLTGEDLSSIKLLIEYGASIDHKSGASIRAAIDRNQIHLFGLLMLQRPNKISLDNAFEACRRNVAFTAQERLYIFDSLFNTGLDCSRNASQISLALIEAVERDPSDTTIPDLLLRNGASTDYDQGRALQSAVLAASLPLVEIILSQGRLADKAVDIAFEKMINSRSISLPEGLRIAQLLLGHGVRKSLIENAMSKALSPTEYISKKEVGLFLSHGAEVNASNGAYFVTAAIREDMELFRLLLVSGKPDTSIIVPAIIQSVLPEKSLIHYLRVLLDNVSHATIMESTLFMAIERFPRGEELVRFLLEHGSTLGSGIKTTISTALGPECVNLVVWALLRENPKVSDGVIVTILQTGREDSSFVAPKTRMSPIILAAKNQRHAVIRELVRQKADLSCRDYQNQSALFYASRNGDLETVRILIQAGALPDDGSLHESARETHSAIVSILLSVGHDAGFPSLLHAGEELGRTPLEELCLNTKCQDDAAWNTRLRETIGMLLHSQGKEIKKDGNKKSVLHLALDNAHPFEITEALLEFPQIWKFINEPIHQFEDSEGFIYSPTKYVEHFYHGPKPVAKELTRLLRGKRCQDCYYSSRDKDQPSDAVGIPKEIAAEIDKRKRRDREQRQEMIRLDELAAHQREIRMQSHQLDMRMSEERHDQGMKQIQDRELFEQQSMQKKHKLTILHEEDLNQQRRNQLEENSKLKIRLLADESIHQQSLLEAERNGELKYKNRLLIQDREAEEAKFNIQKAFLLERDQVDEKQHDRQMQWIDRQDQSVKTRAVEVKSIAEAARYANMPPNLLQLEGPD